MPGLCPQFDPGSPHSSAPSFSSCPPSARLLEPQLTSSMSAADSQSTSSPSPASSPQRLALHFCPLPALPGSPLPAASQVQTIRHTTLSKCTQAAVLTKPFGEHQRPQETAPSSPYTQTRVTSWLLCQHKHLQSGQAGMRQNWGPAHAGAVTENKHSNTTLTRKQTAEGEDRALFYYFHLS